MEVYIAYDPKSFEIDGVYTDLEMAKNGTGAPDGCCFMKEWEKVGNRWRRPYDPDDWPADYPSGDAMIIVKERLIGDIMPTTVDPQPQESEER